MLPVGLCAQLACIWEATARKPGNVHRYRDFEDVSYLDFLISAAAVAPEMEAAASRRVGETVLAAVHSTRQVVSTNTNLGIILLLAPLAAVPRVQPLREGLRAVLDRLDVEDARLVYEAIRLAQPAGLGEVRQQDIRSEPTESLREVMGLAADKDLIARQYINGFREVLEEAVLALRDCLEQRLSLEMAIATSHVYLLHQHLDSLIVRKCGIEEAQQVQDKARQVASGELGKDEFDAWLREEGHRRNPGTTADLLAAALFVMLREGELLPHQLF
jgi:triphosphoribosyl-dephospho-CoA synthase